MPADTVHPAYEKRQEQWQRIRDCIEGEDAVKARGSYLPPLPGADGAAQRSYVQRATFHNATKRTVIGLVGTVMHKDPTWTVPTNLEQRLKNIGAAGESANEIANQLLTEELSVTRVGLLVDTREDGEGEPYWAVYFAENIINWRTTVINGREELTLVVLTEEVQVESDDEFDPEVQLHYRILRLEQTESDWIYSVEILRKREKQSDREPDQWEVVVERFNPTRRAGGTFNRIPFVIDDIYMQEPIALDLANLNLSHFRTSADLEHGRHYTALPTPWAAGFDPKAGLVLGSTTAWVTDQPGAKAGFLEFSGAGLASLEKAMEEKEKQMAVLGARLLEQQKAGVEAAKTVELRHAGEQSILSDSAMVVSEMLTKALQFYSMWLGSSTVDGITCELNRDYVTVTISETMIVTLMSALQQGYLSWDVWFYNLKKGEIIPDSRTQEEEEEAIAAGLPFGNIGKQKAEVELEMMEAAAEAAGEEDQEE